MEQGLPARVVPWQRRAMARKLDPNLYQCGMVPVGLCAARNIEHAKERHGACRERQQNFPSPNHFSDISQLRGGHGAQMTIIFVEDARAIMILNEI